jgi:phosphonate transport system permease protein
MSIIAIAVASVVAWPVSLLASRWREEGATRGAAGAVGAVVRLLLLVTRSVPPPVWALVVVFVVFPGPLAGGLALAVYTFGVLGRLDAEVVETPTSGRPGHSASRGRLGSTPSPTGRCR